ncbi:hypothetical protein conserved [Leishmania donovani]|uniref:Uncharacterized protein n=3 Tax=Leishmania donovani species complex TaxID=38574 RepID=A4I7X7_LEIIN|nr:conserved hypothetical protein [Leishmania infantum JPCM5]TPP47175.1 hypothetical protein CGC20_34150 [Leishmania donovani]CAC9524920.1 hypothetical_protein_-_conserved [Leishmania infantum]CAJ1991702.1 hypothetical protein conserved [Leishmania donovani]CAM70914.1 conserved hypothetical protein [Leishmania infantum JPCM5]SUZ44734.1 hypothetical_protein_-_conserved [Leishmania infantum]|eukprot:XP_001467846.1 conserved hypothetical protein [Leishmania infantum JPCM5]
MAALQHVNSATEITPLLACGGDYVKNGTQTLSIASVYATLDALESLWQAQRERQHLSVRGRAQGLRHYHAVYEASVRCVPLSLTRWEQWLAGLSEQGAQTTMGACPDDLSSSSSPQVQRVQKELVDSYWHLYRRLCWGSSGAAKAGLAAVLEHTESAASELQSVMATGAAALVAEQEAALAKPLQAFARLSAESAHLFADYPLIGKVERLWLSETVLPALGEPAEPLVEMLVRRTFKRDLQVPSVALPELLREYEESEINEHKVKDIVAVGQATLSSSWMRAASALYVHTTRLTDTTRPSDVGGMLEASSLSRDARLKELEEQLLSVLIKVPRGQGFLPALGLLMQRLMEDNGEASASTGPWRGLNGSQTQFYLYLLHQWFATYIGSHHRWSVTDMFAASDDADLWTFLLDRHAVCLTWALVTEKPALQDLAVRTHAETQLGYLDVLATRVDKLRAVFYSVVHCAQLYHASTTAFTKMEKRESRLRTAAAAMHSWMKEIGIETFCRALLNDLFDATAQWEEAQAGYDACVQQRALLVEAELKLILYDTMMMLQCPDRSTERIERLVEAALDMCDAWGTSEREPSGRTSHERKDLVLPIIGMAGRCLHRISASLRCDVASVSAVPEVQASLYRRAVQWVKRCIVAAAAIGGDPSSLWDEWSGLVSIPVFAAEQHSSGESPRRFYPPALLGYAIPATGRGRASRQTAASGGLDDVCWERRTVAKAVRKEVKTGVDGGGSRDDRVSSCIVTAGSGEEESGQPPLKKTRAN